MSTPGAEEESIRNSTTYIDPFDDVFGSAPSSPIRAVQNLDDEQAVDLSPAPSTIARIATDPSDVPRLRSTHVTNGYREGIAASKEKHIQEGFDEGYSLGAEIALKAGYILGALQGLYHGIGEQPRYASPHPNQPLVETSEEAVSIKEEVARMLQEAESALKVEHLFSRAYLGEDGVWIYDIPGQENESSVTFAKVAEAHPVIRSWAKRLIELRDKLDFKLRQN